ncbi:hypothetical protein [Methanocorpusculum sp. GPch4]|uniref:tetratricopeptide repeat protein n=1 Tax=Methanocorpusculum sp. GPch4 TaxID=2527877 RepID=UPI0014329BBE|nr:hypothetical protein [Methanocorpusculum sp. GPch4]
MEYNVSPIRDFLWESYLIRYNTDFLESIQNVSREKKEEFFIGHALDNSFLFRVKRDPGFSLHVRDKVRENANIQERVRHVVLSLFGELAKLSYIPKESLKPKGTFGLIMQKIESGENPFESILDRDKTSKELAEYYNNGLEKEKRVKLDYLNFRLQQAKEQPNNEYEITAIGQSILDFSTELYYGHVLSNENLLDPAAGYTENVLIHIAGFLNRNLKYSDKYNQRHFSEKRPDFIFHELIFNHHPFQLELERVIFGKSVFDHIKENSKDLSYLWKFEADLSTIADFEWFIQFDNDEKLAILNREYPFILRQDMLEEILNLDPSMSSLTIYLNRMVAASFYEPAITLGEFIFRHKDKKGDSRYYLASGIATCYREIERYSKALEWYNVAHGLTKRLDKPNNIYKELVEWKNCAEMEYYSKGSGYFNKEIKKIHLESHKYPKIISSGVVFNLASACRRTGNFELELEYLTEFIKDATDPQQYQHIEEALDRLKILNYYLDENDYTSLRDMDICRDMVEYNSKIQQAINTFQFKEAISWFDKILKIDPNEKVFQIKADFLSEYGSLEEACDLYSKTFDNAKMMECKQICIIGRAIISTELKGEVNDNIKADIAAFIHDFSKYSTKDDLQEWMNAIVKKTARWDNNKLRREFFSVLSENYRQQNLSGCPEMMIGDAAFSLGLCSEARGWYQDACVISKEMLEIPYTKIGDICIIENDLDEAEKWFNLALAQNSKSPIALSGLTNYYVLKTDYVNALTYIKKAITNDPESKIYKKMEENISSLLSSSISFDLIQSDAVKQILHTGDWLFFSAFNGSNSQEYDFGPIIVQYGKGVERYLYESVLAPIKTKIRDDERYCKNRWVLKKYFDTLPTTLKLILGIEDKTLALGQWIYLDNDMSSVKDNEVVKHFIMYIENMGMNSDNRKKIGELCKNLSYERNGAAHITFYTHEEIANKRNPIIKIINEIIGLVSRECN